ncbi:hypothetical protein D3C81_1592750 [compost metagenome]
MSQGDVVRRREGIGGEGFQRADVDFPHRLAGAGAHRGQVSGGDDRQSAAQLAAALLGQGEELLVVVLDGLLQGQLLVRRALPRLALQHIPRTDEGNGAEDGTHLAGTTLEHQQLLLQGRAHRRHHAGIQLRQQGAALAEHGHRIMVAAQHHQPGPSGT